MTLGLILCTLAVRADSFGEWTFPAPDGYEHEVTPFGMTYKGPGGFFLFTASRPAKGQSLASLAPALIEEMTGVPASDQQFLQTLTPEDGGEAAVHVAAGDTAVFMVIVHKRNDRVAAALFGTAQAEVSQEQEALLATLFDPVTPSATRPAAAVWPKPLPSTTAATRARLTVAQARTMRLDPEHIPIPGDFGCFTVEEPRPMSPEPELTLTFAPNFTYTVTDGRLSGQGRWQMEPNDTFDRVVRLNGTLEDEGYIVVNARDTGQVIHIDNPFTDKKQELICLQSGPTLEREQQLMARAAISQGSMSCTDAKGQAFTLLLGSGIYSVPEGKGYVEPALESYSGDTWNGVFRFTTGPLSLYGGKVTGDAYGGVTLELSTEWRTGSLFYSSTETTIHALCRMNVAARPEPIYGQDPAPPAAAPEGGLPEGLYRSFEGRTEVFGTGINYVFAERLTYIAPGGRILRDLDLEEIGGLPDCTKTRLDGHAFCGEYRLNGATYQTRDEGDTAEEDWSDPAPFTITGKRFDIDGIEYTLIEPLDAGALTGTWVADSFTGSGPGMSGGVGVYTDADVFWSLSDDGRFDWHESTSTQTLITPDPVLGGVSGGGSSSSTDAGSGTFTFDGLWMTLKFDDGRTRRVPVLEADDADGTQLQIGPHLMKRG